jgi:hypothetical protein
MKPMFFSSALLLSAYTGAALLCLALPAQAENQGMRDAIKRYDKPAKIQHMSVETPPMSAPSDAPAAPEPSMKSYQVEAAPTTTQNPVKQEQPAQTPTTATPYMRSPQPAVESEQSAKDQEEAERAAAASFSTYKSSGVILTSIERFPDLDELTQWPWLRELTYGPENPATQNALAILDRDLAKASPLAMIWAAQHYYDLGFPDKALFLYLVSRLRSAVDQARFEHREIIDLSASQENVDVERSAGGGTSARAGIKSLSSYKVIASSIGRPIIKFGLKNPKRYETQLRAAMLWDAETSYEYLPSVNDLVVDEGKRDRWDKDYQKIKEVYQRQMLKLIKLSAQ